MAAATEALASTTAEGPTSHTQNQAEQPAVSVTCPPQIAYLLRPIDPTASVRTARASPTWRPGTSAVT
jgi:hypothetical protein